jgi:hypothetical protein
MKAFIIGNGVSIDVGGTPRNLIKEIFGLYGQNNFTKAAEGNNAENFLVIRDKKLAERYTKNWQENVQHSETYVGGGR